MGLIGQNQQDAFANPQAGQQPIASASVRDNDNALRAKHNTHDADATVHVQTGLLSARPTAGTAFAMYMDENKRLYQDNGSAWSEVPYARLDAAGTNVFDNNVEVGGTLDVTGTTTLGATDTGALGVTGDVDASGTVTGAALAGDGSAITAINASNVSTGTLAAARLPATIPTVTITNLTATSTITGDISGSSGSTTNATNATNATQLVVLSNNLKVDASEAQFLTLSGSATGTTAPTGSGATRYINVTIDGVECRLEARTVA
jgi:hypothetical protein